MASGTILPLDAESPSVLLWVCQWAGMPNLGLHQTVPERDEEEGEGGSMKPDDASLFSVLHLRVPIMSLPGCLRLLNHARR